MLTNIKPHTRVHKLAHKSALLFQVEHEYILLQI